MEEEDVIATVKLFFKQKLEIDKDIEVSDAYRVGSYKPRMVVATLANYRDKGLIFSNTKKLKDMVNSFDKPYYVSDQLTAKREAERRRMRQLVKLNEKKSTAEKLTMSIERRKLLVEGREYEKGVRSPTCRELLMPKKEVRMSRLNAKISKGTPIEKDNQCFIGYTAEVKTLQEVNLLYAKVRAMNLDARHVIAAVTIPHREFHTHDDFNDDDEHGGGAFLLNLLLESEIVNRVVFVARYYDGTHIGNRRFDAMRAAIKSAIDAAPTNKVSGRIDGIWQRNLNTTFGIRGGHGGRGAGNRGQGPGRTDRSKMPAKGQYGNPPVAPKPSYAEVTSPKLKNTGTALNEQELVDEWAQNTTGTSLAW